MTTAGLSFPDPLDIQDNDDGTYTLLSPFRYGPSACMGDVNAPGAVCGCTLTVPAKFTTDFASTPRVVWPILPPDGPYGRAAVVHDYLYTTRGLGGAMVRAQCDAVLLEAMIALGVGWLTRLVIFRAVRLFGASHWGP